MAEKKGSWSIGELINAGSGLVLIAIAYFTFIFLFPSSLGDMNRIVQLGPQITGITGYSLGSSLAYTALGASLLITAIALFSVFYNREEVSNSFQKDKNRKFFGFMMIYILVQLILTEIFAYYVSNFGNQFPFTESIGVQNFVFAFLTLEELIVYILLPMVVALVVLGIMRGESILRMLRFYSGTWAETLIISFAIAIVATILLSGNWLDYISDFASFAVLNIIFLRFGFLKAFLTNFAVSLTNVTATLIAGYSTLNTILPLFLFFLGFLGVYSLVQVSFTPHDGTHPNTAQSEPVKSKPAPRQQIEPFIYSRCPECGNTVYHVLLPDISLKCEKCGHELPKDATGERNITIEMGRASRN